MDMDSITRLITDTENSENDSKKPGIRQQVINFKRRKISENEQDFDQSQLLYLDTDTALEPEPLVIEINENDDEEEEQILQIHQDTSVFGELIGVDVMNNHEYILQNAEIVAEELQDGQHPLDDLDELEEGEIKGANIGFRRRYYGSHFAREYKCPLCDRTFSQKGNLMRHYQTHTGTKPFACTLCGHKFTQKSNLQKHIATHNGDKQFECGVCHKGFVQKANLIRHLRIHTGEKPFRCDLCGHKFTQKGNLNKHMQLHSSDAEASCDFCDCSFSSYSAKVRHETAVHGDKQEEMEDSEEVMLRHNFSCNECPAVFRTVRALEKHKKFHE